MPTKNKNEVVTTEATGKKWKLAQLVGFLALLLGGLSYMAVGDGGVLAIAGLAIWLFGRVGAWWFHG